MFDGEFSGKTVLVTGATGGIGRRVSRLAAAGGAQVVLVGRDRVALQELDDQVNREHSIEPRIFLVDLESSSSTSSCADALRRFPSPFHGMVLISPTIPKSSDVIPSDREWRRALDLCFLNPLTLVGAALDNMTADARIVIVSGIASVQVFPSLPITNVVRLAWLAQAKYLAHRLGERGIRVNTLSLGATLTEQFAARLQNRRPSDIPSDETPETIPLREYGDPDDAAYAAVSLLTRFVNHITGNNVTFDGGITRTY